MKRNQLPCLHSQIKTFLSVTVISVISLLFVVVKNYHYLNTVTVQSIVVTESLDSFKNDEDGQHLQSPATPDQLFEEEGDRYKRTGTPIGDGQKRKDQNVVMTQSVFKNSEIWNLDEKIKISEIQNSDEEVGESKIQNSIEKFPKSEIWNSDEKAEESKIQNSHEKFQKSEMWNSDKEVEESKTQNSNEKFQKSEMWNSDEKFKKSEMWNSDEEVEESITQNSNEKFQKSEMWNSDEKVEESKILDSYEKIQKSEMWNSDEKVEESKIQNSHETIQQSEMRNSDENVKESKIQNSHEKLQKSKIRNSHEKCVKRLPQAIIVGIQKSGTTALLYFLNDHPQIAACLHPVETKYFSQYYRKPLTWYRNLMPCSFSNQITIEKSPPYFYRRYCAVGIRKMNPKTKIIIIVKDPITRAVSMYAMLKGKNTLGRMPFEDAVSFKTHSSINGNCPYIDFSNYQKYMRAWLDNFKLEQILVVDGHNLEQNPAQELSKVEHFLGIDIYFTTDRFIFNKTKGKYCLRSDENKMQCLSKKKGRHHPKIDDKITDKLRSYFRPKNVQFFKMINKKLDWGY